MRESVCTDITWVWWLVLRVVEVQAGGAHGRGQVINHVWQPVRHPCPNLTLLTATLSAAICKHSYPKDMVFVCVCVCVCVRGCNCYSASEGAGCSMGGCCFCPCRSSWGGDVRRCVLPPPSPPPPPLLPLPPPPPLHITVCRDCLY